MFYFITTLRHPNNAKNYQAIIDLLLLTIESVCNQKTENKYKFLIVCNEKPNIQVNEDKVEFLTVDFPAPGVGKGEKLAFDAVLKDKGSKLAAGLIWLHQFTPNKVFIIDADDWVNSHTVEYVNKHASVPFWHVNKGSLVNLSSKEYTSKYGLSRYCGSTYIYDYNKLMAILKYNGPMGVKLSQSEIISNFDEFSLLYILGDHRHHFAYFRKNGEKLKPLPLNAISWVLDTGENHSGKTGGNDGLPISNDFLATFGIKSEKLLSKQKNVPIKQFMRAKIAQLSSYVGWTLTDKTKFKV